MPTLYEWMGGIDALVRLTTLFYSRVPDDPLLGRTHYTVGLIEGGVAPNVVPPHASAELLFRVVGEPSPVRGVSVRDTSPPGVPITGPS